MDMTSFYGGPAGRNFEIKDIFTSYYKSNNEAISTHSLEEDLSMGWNSPIPAGSYVVISYGMPNNDNYTTYLNIDMERDKRSYNSTFWIKEYNEEKNPTKGFNYRLIASIAGNTPNFLINQPIEILSPEDSPKVQLDNSIEGSIDEPILYFSLPRAAKFYYGNLLGEKQDYLEQQNESFVDYMRGDYYINEATGFIYQVIKVEDGKVNFKYVARLQAPLPETVTVPINPYTNNGELNKPFVRKRYTNADETKWELEFNLPTAPNVVEKINTTFIAPAAEGSGKVTKVNGDSLEFSLNIPAGAKIYSGIEVDDESLSTEIEGAAAGDVYINNDLGFVYILQSDGAWKKQDGSLKGPVGDALNIVADYSIMIDEQHPDALETGSNYIEETYKGEYDASSLFAVTFVTEKDEQIAYWYFKIDNKWNRVRLTGSVSDSDFYTKEESDDRYLRLATGGKVEAPITTPKIILYPEGYIQPPLTLGYPGVTLSYNEDGGLQLEAAPEMLHGLYGIKVHGVDTPTQDGDAANKKYVDDAVKNASGGGLTQEQADQRYLQLTGGDIEGVLTFNKNTPSGLVINGNIISASQPEAGNGVLIEGVAFQDGLASIYKEPQEITDLVNKKYVDNAIKNNLNIYETAKNNGYDGTEEEFYTLLGNLGITFFNENGARVNGSFTVGNLYITPDGDLYGGSPNGAMTKQLKSLSPLDLVEGGYVDVIRDEETAIINKKYVDDAIGNAIVASY